MIDTPGAPPGWEDRRADLIRVVDPLGRAVAWLAPDHRGRCVGFAVRPFGERGTPWTHIFDGSTAEDPGAGARVAVIDPESNAALDLSRAWRFVKRDPTAATLAAIFDRGSLGDHGHRLDGLDISFSASLHEGRLGLELLVENHGRDDRHLLAVLEIMTSASFPLAAAGAVGGPDHFAHDHGSGAERAASSLILPHSADSMRQHLSDGRNGGDSSQAQNDEGCDNPSHCSHSTNHDARSTEPGEATLVASSDQNAIQFGASFTSREATALNRLEVEPVVGVSRFHLAISAESGAALLSASAAAAPEEPVVMKSGAVLQLAVAIGVSQPSNADVE